MSGMTKEAVLSRILNSVKGVYPKKISTIADLVDRYGVNDPYAFRAEIGSRLQTNIIEEICNAWEACPELTGSYLSVALKAVAFLGKSSQEEVSQLVVTRPWESQSAISDSMTAFLSVIKQAQESLSIAMYVVYKIPEIMEALMEAEGRGVRIRILIEPPQDLGGNLKGGHNSLNVFKDYLSNALFYCPDHSKIPGVVHAKFICADARIAFVTSANLTFAAVKQNIELGLLVVGGGIPMQVEALFDELIVKRYIASC